MARCLARVNQGHELVFIGRPDVDLMRPRDLRDALLRARPDAILSCAAMTSVDTCEGSESAAFTINAEAPGVMAKAAAALGIPIIHLSTDYVFSGTKGAPYVESDAPDPINTYGRSKLEGEVAVAAAPRHAVVRTTWLYSPFGGFLKGALAQAAAGETVRVVSDQIACPTSGLDLARVLIGMVERMAAYDDPTFYGVFHAAGATVANRAEVVRAALALAGYPGMRVDEVRSTDFFAGAPRPFYSALDSRKLAQIYGIRPKEWEETLAEAVQPAS